jgi:hypothetical protein
MLQVQTIDTDDIYMTWYIISVYNYFHNETYLEIRSNLAQIPVDDAYGDLVPLQEKSTTFLS